METAREKAWVDVDRKDGQTHNPNAVLDDQQRQGSERQRSYPPRGSEEDVTSQQARDQQRQTRANPAALLGDLDRDTGQSKGEPGPEDGNSQQLEHRVGDFRRPRLQPKDDSVQEDIGYGNHQKQEQHRK